MELKGLKQVQQELGCEVCWPEFAIIREIRYWKEPEEEERRGYSRRLLIRAESRKSPGLHLVIELTGVADVYIRFENFYDTSGLSVFDISDRGYENLRWMLEDYENDLFRCYACDAEIRLEKV